jgi:hypothetical protein
MRHPDFGELRLQRQRFDIPDSNGQHLHVYYAALGSDTDQRLDQMRSMLAERS